MSKKIKDIVLEIEPKAVIIRNGDVHHIYIDNRLAGRHTRESWAWSQAYQWLLTNNKIKDHEQK